jgi:hypothetical protein
MGWPFKCKFPDPLATKCKVDHSTLFQGSAAKKRAAVKQRALFFK